MQTVQTYKGCENYKIELRELLRTYDAHSEPIIREFGWLTIKQLINAETVKLVYKALHNEAPEYLIEKFHRLSDTQNRVLRNSKTDLHIPLLRKS